MNERSDDLAALELRAIELFQRAVEQPEAGHEDWLRRACGDDVELLHRVQQLLAADAGTSGALGTGAALLAETDAAPLPATIGPYRIERLLGEGGMGRVYLAERADGLFEQEVAIKVVRHSALSAAAVRRFETERQILADLRHPNIARLLDGGTTEDGLPYVVMECIDGEPLNRYLEMTELDLRQRLQLFRQILDGVEFAHRNLIIHRDLKPGNILVEGDGTPRLLDFGIAKPIGVLQKGDDPQTVAMLMTPSYASPEQVRGEALNVASDVYSLGLLLFECLTGEQFNDFKGLSAGAVERALTTDPAPLASRKIAASQPQLARVLRGELDAIVARATAPEPDRRYPTVQSFAADVRAYLAGEPVAARGDSRAYRFGKFLRRHWVSVGASATVALALIVGGSVALWQSNEATRQRDIATREARTANNSVRFLKNTLVAANPLTGGASAESVDDVLRIAEQELYQAFPDDPDTRVFLLASMSEIYVGRGEFDKSRAAIDRALALMQTTGTLPARQRAAVHTAHGLVLLEEGRHRDAADALEHAVDLYRLEESRGYAIASALNSLGAAYSDLDEALAERRYLEAIELHEVGDFNEPESFANALSNMSVLYAQQGKLEPAQRYLARTIEQLELAGVSDARRALTIANHAGMLMRLGRPEEAEPRYLEAKRLLENSVGFEHPESLIALTSLGYLYQQTRNYEDGIPLMTRIVGVAERDFEPTQPIWSYSKSVFGSMLCDAGQTGPGTVQTRQALDARKALYPPNHWVIAATESALGACLLDAGDPSSARPLLESAYEKLLAIRGPDDQTTRLAAARLAKLSTGE